MVGELTHLREFSVTEVVKFALAKALIEAKNHNVHLNSDQLELTLSQVSQ